MPSPNAPGLLLTFEGIDGSGKSTQARLVAQWLREQGRSVVSTREPTDGPHGTRIRQARFTERLSPTDELEAFIADRQEHVTQLIAPALARGEVVVIDRYFHSTAAYQGTRGLDPRAIVERHATFAPTPDVVVLVDVPPPLARRRIEARGAGVDLFEAEAALTAVRAVFLSLVDETFAVIDGARSETEVFASIRDTLSARLFSPRA